MSQGLGRAIGQFVKLVCISIIIYLFVICMSHAVKLPWSGVLQRLDIDCVGVNWTYYLLVVFLDVCGDLELGLTCVVGVLSSIHDKCLQSLLCKEIFEVVIL